MPLIQQFATDRLVVSIEQLDVGMGRKGNARHIESQRAIVVQRTHLHALFHFVGVQAIDTGEGSRVNGELILLLGTPFGTDAILTGEAFHLLETIGNVVPQSVHLQAQMYGSRIDAGQRFFKVK